MSYGVSKLAARGFLGKRLIDRMWHTEPGRLAATLDRILYDATVAPEPNEAARKADAALLGRGRHLALGLDVYVTEKDGADKAGRVGTEDTLRLIRDYLEACALREVTTD